MYSWEASEATTSASGRTEAQTRMCWNTDSVLLTITYYPPFVNDYFFVAQLKLCPSLISKVTFKGSYLFFPIYPVFTVVKAYSSVYLPLPTVNRLCVMRTRVTPSFMHSLTHSFPYQISLKYLLCARFCARCLFMVLLSSFQRREGIQYILILKLNGELTGWIDGWIGL